MRKFIKNLTNIALNPIGLTTLKTKELNSLQSRQDALVALYNARCHQGRKSLSSTCSCIVFSKDRALQLHALLSSYFDLLTNPAPVVVLFQTSNCAHAHAYDEVAALFAKHPVQFHPQTSQSSFKPDLVAILEKLTSDKIFFLVDDIIVVEQIDLRSFTSFDTDQFVPSLRLGENLTYCYTLNQQQRLPRWSEPARCPQSMISWTWESGEHDWAYPLSVDGHLFARWELLAMTETIAFSAPNSYEYALQQFLSVFQNRLGIACKKSVIINIPWNRVQDENNNLSGGVHQDFLLDKWREGKQIDYRKLYGMINISAHQEVSLALTTR